MDLNIRLIDPFDKVKPNPLQQCLLTMDLSGSGIQFRHIIAGRGSSKTVGVILLLLKLALEEKCISLYLCPTYRILSDVFLTVWRDVIPHQVYKYKAAEKKIILLNGSEIWLRSRKINDKVRAEDELRGISCQYIVSDEEAMGFSKKFFTTSLACLRKGRQRAYITVSTPKISAFSELLKEPQHKVFTFTSSVNPHLPPGFVEAARQEMSEMEFRREILGEFVDLGGRVFSGFSATDYYDGGNLIDYVYDPHRPYILSMDIGSSTASMVLWQVVQINGQEKYIAFSEFNGTKTEDNSIRRLMEKALTDYGPPGRVVAGNDLNTRESVSAQTGIMFVRQILGPVQVMMPEGVQRSKEVQFDLVSSLVKNGAGQRKLLVSKNIKSYDPQGRGILKMFSSYAWPERPLKSEILPCDNFYDHVADAVCYFCVTIQPPRFVKTNYF